jgi:hypothetical protein
MPTVFAVLALTIGPVVEAYTRYGGKVATYVACAVMLAFISGVETGGNLRRIQERCHRAGHGEEPQSRP